MNELYSSSLGRAAAIVRQRSHVNNLGDLDTGTMDGANGRLTAVAGTLDIGLHLAQAQVVSYLGTILGSHLSGVGSILLGTTEAHLASRRPRNHLTLAIGQTNNNIVE